MFDMKYIVFFIFITLLLLLTKSIAESIQNLSKGRQAYVDLNRELASKRREHAYLRQKLEYVKSEDFIESEAREKLGLVKEGEYIVIAPPATDGSKLTKTSDQTPNWKKWWKLFF